MGKTKSGDDDGTRRPAKVNDGSFYQDDSNTISSLSGWVDDDGRTRAPAQGGESFLAGNKINTIFEELLSIPDAQEEIFPTQLALVEDYDTSLQDQNDRLTKLLAPVSLEDQQQQQHNNNDDNNIMMPTRFPLPIPMPKIMPTPGHQQRPLPVVTPAEDEMMTVDSSSSSSTNKERQKKKRTIQKAKPAPRRKFDRQPRRSKST